MKRIVMFLSFAAVLAITAIAQTSPLSANGMSCKNCCGDKCGQSCCKDGCKGSCCK